MCSLSSPTHDDLSLDRNYKNSIDDLLLPDELIVDILLRLPVKSLIKSTCVCKLWHSIINGAYFVNTHSSRSRADPYIFISHRHSPSVIVISDNSFITRHQDFSFPFETQSTYVELIGACNGLICVTDADLQYRDHHIYLTNPFIHKYKLLDVQFSCYADLIGEKETNVNIGFGYCEVENDYKVLRIIMHIVDHVDTIGYELTTRVEIYSLNSGKWKALDNTIAIENCGKLKVQDIEIAPLFSPVFADGCLYWQGAHLDQTVDNLKVDEYILCFDLKDEIFRRIELPKTYHQLSSEWHDHFLDKNGSVAIVLHPKNNTSVIWLLVLEHKFGGQVQWKEFKYKCASIQTYHCLGFGPMGLKGGERLFFVTYSDSEDLSEYIVAVDLDNECAIEKFALDFAKDIIIHKAINVFESLVSI